VRLRESLSRAKAAPLKKDDTRVAAKTSAEAASDIPTGPTLHGYPGGPPKGTDMSQFKIVIPKRGEERKDNPEAGNGRATERKGGAPECGSRTAAPAATPGRGLRIRGEVSAKERGGGRAPPPVKKSRRVNQYRCQHASVRRAAVSVAADRARVAAGGVGVAA